MWQRFGIATASAGQTDRRSDVMQVALLALTLLVDRPLGPEDYPRGLLPLLREASARLLTGDGIVLQMWFRRALGLEEPAFADAGDAMAALDALLWDAPGQWNAGLLPGATETAAARTFASGCPSGAGARPTPDDATRIHSLCPAGHGVRAPGRASDRPGRSPAALGRRGVRHPRAR